MIQRHAPPVVYPLGRSRFQAVLLVMFWLAGLLCLLAWFFLVPRFDWRIGLAFLAVLASGFGAFFNWKNAAVGQLRWDGQLWFWESSGYQTGATEQNLSVILDFQQVMLLLLENPAHARLYLWVERHNMPERWLDLRRAVHGPRQAYGLSAHTTPLVAVSGVLAADTAKTTQP